METILLILTIVLLIAILLLQFSRKPEDHRDEFRRLQEDNERLRNQLQSESRTNRDEMARTDKDNQQLMGDHLDRFGNQQKDVLAGFRQDVKDLKDSLGRSLGDMRLQVTTNLENIRKDNNEKLEKMRETVDEKLHKTLEERLGRSFEKVSQHLEAVQRGLGEMQSLASGVGDLKKVLANVKTRGVMGEIQLGNILEQILAPEQYGVNVATIPGSRNLVEFAIRFPGKDDDGNHVWLPIDSKFPLDRYEQVLNAYERGDTAEIEKAQKDLLNTVKLMAREIGEKYIGPPHTTDFGILFLPVEGLFAEVVRHPALLEDLQRNHRVMIAGPTNLAAFLNSLQMGFRSLAIEKRSSEVWQILGAVKTEFGKFGDVLDKVQTKLQQASKTIDSAGVRTRAIERTLRGVEALPEAENPEKIGQYDPSELLDN